MGCAKAGVPALEMARGLSLVAILHVVASLESLRGGEERARGLTCRWSWKTSRISKTSVKLNTTEWNFVMMVRGGGLGSYTTLPFCLPMLYSRLLPPHGIWVSSDDIQHNTDQPGSHGICRPGAGWADCLKRKTWSSLVHDQPFNLLAGHSLTSDCIFGWVQDFRLVIRPDLNRSSWQHVNFWATDELWLPEVGPQMILMAILCFQNRWVLPTLKRWRCWACLGVWGSWGYAVTRRWPDAGCVTKTHP